MSLGEGLVDSIPETVNDPGYAPSSCLTEVSALQRVCNWLKSVGVVQSLEFLKKS